MNGKTIAILALVAVLAFVLGLNAMHATRDAAPSADVHVVAIEEISEPEAEAMVHENRPSRDLEITRWWDLRWWGDDAFTALTSMEGMEGAEGEKIGGFEQLVQKKFTTPVIMVVAGIGILVIAAGYGFIRKDLKGPLTIALFVAAPLIVGGVAFEAWPPLAPILFVVAIIGGIAYALTCTKRGQAILDKLTRKDEALTDVVKAIETVDAARKFAAVPDDKSETKRIKETVAKVSAVNGGTTSAEVKKITG